MVEAISGNILKHLPPAVRPKHLDLIDARAAPYTEVQSQIALREIAAAASHLVHLA